MWDSVKLEDLFKIGSSKRVLKAEWKDSGVPFYRGREITTLSKSGAVDNDLFISEEHFSKLKANNGVPQSGDLLVTAIGTIGNTYIVREQDRFYFKDASVLWLHKTSDVDSRFVNYWFNSSLFYSQLEVGNGATVDTLSISKLKAMNFLLPPLAEQERIVAKLDAAFAEIDEAFEVAKEGLENINVLQKNYIDDLFKSISGEKTILENVTSALTCGVAKRPNYTDEGVPFLSARNVKNGKMKWENYKYVDNDTHLKLTKYNKPEIGDILYSRVGAGFGDAAIIDKNIEFSIFVSLTLIKPDKELHNEYLCHYLNSSFVKKLAASSITGTGVGNLNVGAVRKFPITVISKEQQILVSEKINVFLKKLDKLKFINKKKINSLQALKSAILAQELQSSEAA